MFIILMYDINSKRVNKVLKICRKYLTWVQNSVLEGNITNANLERMIVEIKAVIKEEEDSVLYYKFRTLAYSERVNIGVVKGEETNIL
ncbi:MAG: CRISPR-associated endonuclease Cas2 [Bacillota bacterium]|nr:CRISPR-associated endonuclease Cas2 [Bacillota bacterium]